MKITFIGWTITLLGLYLWSKTSLGYDVIFKALALCLLLLLVGHYKEIDNLMVIKQA